MDSESRYLASLLEWTLETARPIPSPPSGVSWRRLEGWALEQSVPALLASLAAYEGLPPEERVRFAETSRRLALRGAMLSLELERILPTLEALGSHPIVLKGAALARTVYPSPAARFFADLDLLVDGKDAALTAVEHLRHQGYICDDRHRDRSFWHRYHFHQALRSPSGFTIELHWDLARPGDYCRFDLEGFRARSRLLPGLPCPFRIPNESDQLLHAASQSLRAGFVHIRRVIDAAYLVRAGAAADAGLADRAHRQGLATSLWLLLELTRSLAGVAPPIELERRLRPTPTVRRCLESLDLKDRALRGPGARRAGVRLWIRILCAPDLRSAREVVCRFLIPAEADHLDAGAAPGEVPGRLARLRLSAWRAGFLAAGLGYLAWRLGSGASRRRSE